MVILYGNKLWLTHSRDISLKTFRVLICSKEAFTVFEAKIHLLFQKKQLRVLWWVLVSVLGALILGTYLARVITTGGFDFFA